MNMGKGSMAKLRHQVHKHAFSSRKRIIISVVAVLVVPIVLIQLFYSTNALLPNMAVGSVKLGGISKEEAVTQLDTAYANAEVPVYFSDSEEAVIKPKLADLGIEARNEARVANYDYPFIWRLVPSSLFWYQSLIDKGEPTVTRDNDTLATYATSHFGDDCNFKPSNGTITYKDGALQLVEATRGGSCDHDELMAKLEGVNVQLHPQQITVTGTSTAPEISTDVARAEFDRLMKQLGEGVALKVEDATETIPAGTIAPWISYTAKDGKLVLGFNTDKATAWLKDTYAKRFTSEPGTTVISTRDFAEVSRETGKNGQALNTKTTIANILKDLKGEADSATLAIDITKPKVTYKRSYSSTDTGLSAVMKNYADTHPGTYGVKMIELSGQRRNAAYNATSQFTTASTYKLFVAYSILLRIERGDLSWSSPSYNGYTVSKCFDMMIKLSNNECAINFLNKVGFAGVTNDAQAIGAKNTSFMGNDGIKSTANDEALFLSLLYSGQILSQQSSRDRLITAMKGNVYREGIPSGIPNATVADKVGFLDALLHDASIVYSPKGTYVLIILTNNASWGNIAELAKEIESVR